MSWQAQDHRVLTAALKRSLLEREEQTTVCFICLEYLEQLANLYVNLHRTTNHKTIIIVLYDLRASGFSRGSAHTAGTENPPTSPWRPGAVTLCSILTLTLQPN